MSKKNFVNLDGVLLLDKPVGISSSQANLTVKRLLHAAKAGHTGSLDVLASGLLPVCLGEATKFSHLLLEADKRYVTVAKLGQRTTTCDAEGEVVETKSTAHLGQYDIEKVLAKFLGEITQVPSMFSALKRQGRPLYQLARQGIEVERKPRAITIYSIQLLSFIDDEIELRVHCSKGTYIRNLVDDIGQALGCGAYVKELRRTASGSFNLEQAMTLAELEQQITNIGTVSLLPVDILLYQYPRLNLTQEQAQRLQQGQQILLSHTEAVGKVRAYQEDRFLGLAELIAPDQLIAVRLCCC